MSKLTVAKMAEDLQLKIRAGAQGVFREIKSSNVTRPGLEFSGFFDCYEKDYILYIGNKEMTYFAKLSPKIQEERLHLIFSALPPVIIFNYTAKVPEMFITYGNQYSVTILKDESKRYELVSKIHVYLLEKLAKRIPVHGVLIDINGLGTLITGQSGIGKSEVALELIKRGHQLISDDRVDIYQKEVGILIGEAPEVSKRYLEIRGVGIVDVINMFGVSSFRENKKVRLVVELAKWNDQMDYKRLEFTNQTIKYFDTEIPILKIPVSPGRNLAAIVEACASNQKLKYLGYNAYEAFTNAINQLIMTNMEENNDVS